MDFVLAVALKQESQGNFETLGLPVIYTGLGKLNAAINLLAGLVYFNARALPKAVINLGTVGSGAIPETKIVQITTFVQRDMLCEPLAPKYHTPFDDDGGPIVLKAYTDRYDQVICGTGDSFVKSDILKMTTGPYPGYDVVDMEGFAMAKVCKILEIPFISLKYVSDSGETTDWEKRLELASKALTHEAKNLLGDLSKVLY